LLQQVRRIGLSAMLGEPTAGEAIYVCAGESCLFSRGRVPEDPATVRAGENAAGRDRIVLCGLLFDGAAQVRDGLFELLWAAAAAHDAGRKAEEVSHVRTPPSRFPGRTSCRRPILFPETERSDPEAAPLLLLVGEGLLHALEDGGDAHAPADAEGDETVAAARAREVVQHLDGQDGAGGPDGVSEGDGPAYRI
jgi:hypothetical protein